MLEENRRVGDRSKHRFDPLARRATAHTIGEDIDTATALAPRRDWRSGLRDASWQFKRYYEPMETKIAHWRALNEEIGSSSKHLY